MKTHHNRGGVFGLVLSSWLGEVGPLLRGDWEKQSATCVNSIDRIAF